ncbi:MAG TPA: hypothetical protein VNH21_12435 [Steroidobacteraceae bacterium]|nr:hypothetical protein [Steroidobacteraceae bacterium]
MDPILDPERDNAFRREVETVINRYSRENSSDTPDFILAEYLTDCLAAFDKGVRERERWYGRYVMGRPGAPGQRPFPRNKVGLRMDQPIPGSADEGPGVMPLGKSP